MRDVGVQVLSLNDLTRSKVEVLLEESFDGEHKFMDDYTFCLFDISDYRVADLRSIVIQKNGVMYFSKRTTKHLLDEYSLSFNHLHERTCLAASVLGFHQKIPYVIGERCVIPLDGYTKKPTTWVVANHAVRKSYDRLDNILHLTSRRNVVLSLSTTKNVFDDQILRAVQILKFKLALHHGQMKEYQYTYRNPHYRPMSILSMPFEQISFETPDLTYFEAEMKVREYLERKRVKKALGEGNPYYEDYLEEFH